MGKLKPFCLFVKEHAVESYYTFIELTKLCNHTD